MGGWMGEGVFGEGWIGPGLERWMGFEDTRRGVSLRARRRVSRAKEEATFVRGGREMRYIQGCVYLLD